MARIYVMFSDFAYYTISANELLICKIAGSA